MLGQEAPLGRRCEAVREEVWLGMARWMGGKDAGWIAMSGVGRFRVMTGPGCGGGARATCPREPPEDARATWPGTQRLRGLAAQARGPEFGSRRPSTAQGSLALALTSGVTAWNNLLRERSLRRLPARLDCCGPPRCGLRRPGPALGRLLPPHSPGSSSSPAPDWAN